MRPGPRRRVLRERTGLGLLTTLGIGCGAEVVYLEAPEIEGARSVLFAVEPDLRLELRAMNVPVERFSFAIDPSFDQDVELHLTRIALEQPLASLGLAPGPIEPSPPPNQPLSALATLAIDAVRLTPEMANARFEPPDLSIELRTFLLPSLSSCPSSTVVRELASLPNGREVVSVDRTMAVALSRELVMVVRDDKSIQTFALPEGETGAAIARSDTGRVWVATSTSVRSFEPATGAFGEPEIPVLEGVTPIGMLVREAEGALDVWIFDDEGQLSRHTTGALGLQRIFQVPARRIAANLGMNAARFAATENGGFALVCRNIASLFEYRPSFSPDLIEELDGKSFADVHARADGSLVVVDNTTGEIFERREDAWQSFGVGTTETLALAPISENRLLYATRPGSLGVLALSGAPCETQTGSGLHVPRALAPVGSGFIVLSSGTDGRNKLSWIELLESD